MKSGRRVLTLPELRGRCGQCSVGYDASTTLWRNEDGTAGERGLAGQRLLGQASGVPVARPGPYERVRVVCLRDSALLLVQHRWRDGTYFWLLPGGGIKPGETIEDAAAREVWEEAGVRIRTIRALMRPDGVTGAGPEHAFVLAEPLDGETRGPQPTVDGDEVFAVEWHSITDATPIGGLTPAYWSPLAPLLSELVKERATAQPPG